MNRRPSGAWRPMAVATLALAAVALAGCSGGATTPASPIPTTSVDLPKSYKFVPPAIVVDVGATVSWTNDDNFTHNVTFDGEAGMPLHPGESATKTFPAVGTFHYQCTLHPKDMQGTVTVRG